MTDNLRVLWMHRCAKKIECLKNGFNTAYGHGGWAKEINAFQDEAKRLGLTWKFPREHNSDTDPCVYQMSDGRIFSDENPV